MKFIFANVKHTDKLYMHLLIQNDKKQNFQYILFPHYRKQKYKKKTCLFRHILQENNHLISRF